MTADYAARLREAANAPVTHGGGCGMPPMAVVAQADLTAALDELERLRPFLFPAHPRVDIETLVNIANDKREQAERDAEGWRSEALRLRAELEQLRNERDVLKRAYDNCYEAYRKMLCADGDDGTDRESPETASASPAGGLDGTGEGQRTGTPARGPQQGSEGNGGERG